MFSIRDLVQWNKLSWSPEYPKHTRYSWHKEKEYQAELRGPGIVIDVCMKAHKSNVQYPDEHKMHTQQCLVYWFKSRETKWYWCYDLKLIQWGGVHDDEIDLDLSACNDGMSALAKELKEFVEQKKKNMGEE